MPVLTMLFAASVAVAQVTAKSTPTPKPSAQPLPMWYQALTHNEALRVAVSISGLGQFQALEVSGLPSRPRSGQATGKRQHMPMRFRIYYDAATSPAAVKAALKTGRSFPSMTIKGATLKNARVESAQPVPKPPASKHDTHEIELVSFVYQQIEW